LNKGQLLLAASQSNKLQDQLAVVPEDESTPAVAQIQQEAGKLLLQVKQFESWKKQLGQRIQFMASASDQKK